MPILSPRCELSRQGGAGGGRKEGQERSKQEGRVYGSSHDIFREREKIGLREAGRVIKDNVLRAVGRPGNRPH